MAGKEMRSDGPILDPAVMEAIYDAAINETRWADTLSHIANWLNAEGAMYCVLSKDAPQPTIEAVAFHGYTAESELAYAGSQSLLDPHTPLGLATPVRSWFLSHDHFDRKFVERDAFFQQVMNPAGIRWVTGTRLWDTPEAISCIAFQRAIDARPFSESDRQRLAAVTPHLSRATSLHHRLMKRELGSRSGLAAMDNLNFGIAILDSARRILFSNATAERYFDEKNVFKRTFANRLTLRHSDCCSQFAKSITRAVGSATSALMIQDEHGKAVLSAMVMPLSAGSQLNLQWQRPLAMVVLSELHRSSDQISSAVLQLFNLTPAEGALANGLMRGLSIEEFANERKVSIETVRTQSKSLLAKTGSRRQAELVAMLARLPNTLNQR